MKHTLNYKDVFNTPVQFKQITKKFSLQTFVSMERVAYFFAILFILLVFFSGIISKVNEIYPTSALFIYLLVPIFGSKKILGINPDGKKVHEYLFGIAVYYLTVVLPKKKICNDEVVKYCDLLYEFEEFDDRNVCEDELFMFDETVKLLR